MSAPGNGRQEDASGREVESDEGEDTFDINAPTGPRKKGFNFPLLALTSPATLIRLQSAKLRHAQRKALEGDPNEKNHWLTRIIAHLYF